MKRVEAIIRSERLGEVAACLQLAGLSGYTISDVRGHGSAPSGAGEYRGHTYELLVTHKLLVTVFVETDEVDQAVRAINAGAATGQVGDGIIAVSTVDAMYRITGANAANGIGNAAANGTDAGK